MELQNLRGDCKCIAVVFGQYSSRQNEPQILCKRYQNILRIKQTLNKLLHEADMPILTPKSDIKHDQKSLRKKETPKELLQEAYCMLILTPKPDKLFFICSILLDEP